MSDNNPRIEPSTFNTLNYDVTESILSHLPISSLVRFTLVSKLWRSIIISLPPSSSSSPSSPPWLFLFGIHNTSSFHNQSFAFDPLSNAWLRLPSSFPSDHLVGSNRFIFTTAPRFSFSPILKPNWRFTSPVRFPRINPLLSVFTTLSGSSKLILVGGSSRIGGLVDIEERLAVQIYDPALDSWELCPPLPADFRSGQDHQTLTSALFKRRFYVFDNYSYFISSFCLDSYTWSDVQTLKPPGLSFAFLNSCNGMLVLGGMCGFSFNLWRIEEGSMEFSEIAVMPEDLLFGLVDDNEDEEEDSNKFRSLKCVGSGNVIYVFNDDCHKKYPACVCEIGGGGGGDDGNGKCSWRRVPHLPCPVNKFHKVVSFCSTVSISDVFHPEEAQVGGSIRA